jgi:hypothetical protein
MAFIEFETPQEAVRAMEKDRAKFGPEYGDRFCMLQLVGRHEMDKVTLQREGDGGGHNKMMVRGDTLGVSCRRRRVRARAAAAGACGAWRPACRSCLFAWPCTPGGVVDRSAQALRLHEQLHTHNTHIHTHTHTRTHLESDDLPTAPRLLTPNRVA